MVPNRPWTARDSSDGDLWKRVPVVVFKGYLNAVRWRSGGRSSITID